MARRKEKEGFVPRTLTFKIDVDRRQPCDDEPLTGDDRKAFRRKLSQEIEYCRTMYAKVTAQIILALQAASELGWEKVKPPKDKKTGKTQGRHRQKKAKSGTPKVKTFQEYFLRCSYDEAYLEAVLSFLGKTGKKRGYAIREYLRENFFRDGEWWSDTCDFCLNYVEDTLKRKCPDLNDIPFHKAIVLGKMDAPKYERPGIRFRGKMIRITANSISIKWSPKLGWVQFYFVKRGKRYFDGPRRQLLQNLRDGIWKVGRVEVKEYKGGLSAEITFNRPVENHDVDPNKVLAVTFSMDDENIENFISGQVLEDETYTPKRFEEFRRMDFTAVAAVDQMKNLSAATEKNLTLMRACGYRHARNPAQGIKKARTRYSERLARVSKRRSDTVRTWNQRWICCVIKESIRLHCGKIRLYQFPKVGQKRKALLDGVEPKELLELGIPEKYVPLILSVRTEKELQRKVLTRLHCEPDVEALVNTVLSILDEREIRPTSSLLFGCPWQWDHFENHLKIKCQDNGLVLDKSKHKLNMDDIVDDAAGA